MNNNFKFKNIFIGQEEFFEDSISVSDIDSFIRLSGDSSSIHSSYESAVSRGFRDRVVHGALIIAKISKLVGTVLPGDSCLLLEIDIKFRKPLYTDEKIIVSAVVFDKHESVRCITMKLCVSSIDKNITYAKGSALVRVLDD